MSYLEDLRERGREANPFFGLMGIEIVSFGGGEATLSMEVRPDMLNGAGRLQGGIYAALADEAMALALFTLLEEGETIATISQTTSYFSGICEGRIFSTGKVARRGRQVAFTEGIVMAKSVDGPVLSKTSASFSIIRIR